MRKKIFTAAFAAVILLCSCTVQARPSSTAGVSQDDEVETIFRQFRNEKNVTYINLPKSLIKMGLKSSNDKTADALAAQIDGIQILTLEAASQKTRDAFCKRFNGLEEKSYEPMVKTNDGGEKVRILVKGDEKEVQSLVILAIDKDDCSLIKINGHINPADIDAIVDMETK